MVLAKRDMEDMAQTLRMSLQLSYDDPLDPFRIKMTGVKITSLRGIRDLDSSLADFLLGEGSPGWSAMSVPIDEQQEHWVVVVNESHDECRRRVSLLEELWHIMQGHKLTSVVRVGSVYGRTFEHEEEHDAYFLAAATLLPEPAVQDMISQKRSVEVVASQFGVSKDLVEYRIKRLGLWNQYKGKQITIDPSS